MARFNPPFHERQVVDADGVTWGAHATEPTVAGGFDREPPPGSAPRERWMRFLSEKGEQRAVRIGLMDPGHREAFSAELLELLARARKAR